MVVSGRKDTGVRLSGVALDLARLNAAGAAVSGRKGRVFDASGSERQVR